MSEQLIADLRRDASRVRCSIAMEQNIHKICEELTAAQQRVDRLRELLRDLAFELKDIAPCHSDRINAELAKGE